MFLIFICVLSLSLSLYIYIYIYIYIISSLYEIVMHYVQLVPRRLHEITYSCWFVAKVCRIVGELLHPGFQNSSNIDRTCVLP